MEGTNDATSAVSGRSSRTQKSGVSKKQVDQRDVLYEFRELLDASLCERICNSQAIEQRRRLGRCEEDGHQEGGSEVKPTTDADDSFLEEEGISDEAYVRHIVETLSVGKALGGYLPVMYYLDSCQDGFGRMKAEVQVDGTRHLLPYVYLQREVRGHLASRYYWDVDLVNCQPSIMLQRLDLLDIPCPLLNRYVNHRKESLEEVQTACQVSREAAKKLFLRLLYLGSPTGWMKEYGVPADRELPPWIQAFAEELQLNARRLTEHPENADLRHHFVQRSTLNAQGGNRSSKRKNPLATLLSLLLQTEERKCVCALVEAICADGRDVGGIIHDGVHVAKQPGETTADPIAAVQIKRWQHRILKDTGYAMKLTVKPFDLDPSYLDADEDKWDNSFLDGKFLLPYQDLKERWEQRSFKVIQTATYVREQEDGRHMMSDKLLRDAYGHIKHLAVSHSNGSVEVQQQAFIPVWTKDNLIRCYTSLVLKPPPLVVPKGAYNIWNGFAAERYRARPGRPVSSQSADVVFLLEFVDILCNRERDVSEYLLDWLAQIFQQPSKKIGISIILRGDQGVGKNRFADLCGKLCGPDKCLETASPQTTLYGTYTSMREGKFLIIINEASGGDNIPFCGQLKDMVTSTSFVSNAKYISPYAMDCYDRFIFTTNNDNCIKLEQGDRRFLIIDVSSELKDEADYFARLSRIIDDEHARHEFYQHLMERDLSHRTDWAKQRPHRSGYTEMLVSSLDYEHQFFKDFVVSMAREQNRIVHMLSEVLFEEFKKWLAEKGPSYGKHNTSLHRFGHKMSRLVAEGPRAKTGFKSVTKQKVTAGARYSIDVPVCMKEMLTRRWITQDDVPVLF